MRNLSRRLGLYRGYEPSYVVQFLHFKTFKAYTENFKIKINDRQPYLYVQVLIYRSYAINYVNNMTTEASAKIGICT